MTILGLMQEVFPLAKLHMDGEGCRANLMTEDHDGYFWLKEITEEQSKEIAKRFTNYIYGFKNAHVFYKDTDSVNPWQEIPLFMKDMTVEQLFEIIDDAVANGFEFKVENTRLLWREKE